MNTHTRPGSRTSFVVLAAIVLLVPTLATACSCYESYSPWIAVFSAADAVFTGKVRSVTQVKRERNEAFVGDRLVTFEVAKAYKGIASSTRLISLYADYDSTSCSFGVDSRKGPRLGEIWIVVADKTETPQMFFGGSCNSSRKIRSKDQLDGIEKEAFKFPQLQGIVGTVVLNYMRLAKDVDFTLTGEGITKTLRVDEKGYYWFPLDRPGNYVVTGKIPFRTTLISSGRSRPGPSPGTFDISESGTTYTYTVDLKAGEYHYHEVNVNEPRKDSVSDKAPLLRD